MAIKEVEEIKKYFSIFFIEYCRSTGKGLGLLSIEEQYLYLYAYYHYFNADSSKFDEVALGNVHSSSAIDKICGIYVDEESDCCDWNAIIPIYVEDGETFPISLVAKYLGDAEQALLNKYLQRAEIKSFCLENGDISPSAEKPLCIRVITNYIPKASEKKNMQKTISYLIPKNTDVSFSLVFGDEICYEIMEVENPKEYVDCAELELGKSATFSMYGDEKSLLLNISAKSLKTLYEQYGYRGLFSQNLRYYVKNTKIDDKVVESMQNHPENFWYYNNGIIIICSDYCIQNSSILLREFSIINGGQTTKLIGVTDFDVDFEVQCKVIKNKYSDENEKLEFISKVAEASNTQKPIKDKDLIANRPEQRQLKKQLADAGIYCQIKRGEKVNKRLYPNAWQNTTNEELGQFLFSFVYQSPGIARASKSSITGSRDRYNLIFGKRYSSDLISDLLKIKAYYKLWQKDIENIKKTITDPYKVGLVKNGMMYMFAIVGAVTKLSFQDSTLNRLEKASIGQQMLDILSGHDIDHHILREGVTKEELYRLFEYCYSTFFRPAYEDYREAKNDSGVSYSNFTKSQSTYAKYVLYFFKREYRGGIPKYDRDILSSILYSPTEDDLQHDYEISLEYQDEVFAEPSAEITLEIIEKIKESLKEFRSKKCKEQKLRTYDVIKNKSLERIALYAPQNIESLKKLKCLSDDQLNLYGEQIVEIVEECLQSS